MLYFWRLLIHDESFLLKLAGFNKNIMWYEGLQKYPQVFVLIQRLVYGLIILQIVDEESKEAAVVDPVEPEHILAQLKGKDIKLTKILTTHHHW